MSRYLAKFVVTPNNIGFLDMSTPVTVDAYLLLGTNMGNREERLQEALRYLEQEAGYITQTSSIYETAAWGNENQPHYLNQVVLVTTALQPFQLLEIINAIEGKMGRVRVTKWESRPIDIDILFYGDQVIDTAELQVPHPQLPNRRFALMPLQEIAPLLVHPVLRKTIADVLRQTPDRLPVHLYKTNTYD
ncbi:2-amino-4-hydroxy-6-hydroxymethyldihydropteridine diphosphokinase [Parapedobacter sp. DT-150]|uniref:2-amino-4-hydroxy-6- hydroxymethyldihydropteridine diphosphokinase n=1 Tax=Parapedobacter sp. DT-150 TaxID=3396162 RepID=UPI003F1B5346